MRKTLWRSFKTAAWLGWQVEANWTHPALYTLYTLGKPLALAGILVVLYATASRGGLGSPLFSYMYVGNAFYIYVDTLMTGMINGLIEDRERYHTLRAVYVAPVDVRWYAAGRGVARFLAGTASVGVTLGVGVAFFHVPVRAGSANWPLFAVALVTGIVMLAMLGLMLTGLSLLLPSNAWSLGAGVSGALYLCSGAIFPIDVLPRVLRPISLALPMTYWLELLRRSLLGEGVLRGLPQLSDVELLGILAGLTVLQSAVGLLVFAWCDWQARERGMIDRVTGF